MGHIDEYIKANKGLVEEIEHLRQDSAALTNTNIDLRQQLAKAESDAARLGAENNRMCDEIFALQQRPVVTEAEIVQVLEDAYWGAGGVWVKHEAAAVMALLQSRSMPVRTATEWAKLLRGTLNDLDHEYLCWDRLTAGCKEAYVKAFEKIIPLPAKPIAYTTSVTAKQAHLVWYNTSSAGESKDFQAVIDLVLANIQPIPAPHYAPEDVAFSSRVPELERQLAEAKAKIENQRMALNAIRLRDERNSRAALVGPIDAQIEALARVLIHAIDGISELDGCSGEQQDKWRMVARAAVDFMRAAPPENLLTRHLLHQTGQADIGHALETISDWKATALRVGPPVAVDPDAWKTPLEITDDDGSSIELAHRGVTFEVVSRGDTYPHLSPADAARAAQWLASYAAAHGCPVGLPPMMGIDPAKPGSEETVVRHFCTGPTRAEAEEKWETVAGHMTMPARAFIDWLLPQLPTERAEMPTPNDLARIIRRHATVERWDHVTAEAILAALRPWFREPTGWELDVDPGWHLQGTTNSFGLTRAAVDYLTSRIRPTFECAECKYRQTKIHRLEGWIQSLEGYVDDMRKLAKTLPVTSAALEGE